MDAKLLEYMLEKRYKVVCDAIKVQILDTLIKMTDERKYSDGSPMPIITKYDLILIRDEIQKLREKETDEERKAIIEVIGHLTSRGNSEIIETVVKQ